MAPNNEGTNDCAFDLELLRRAAANDQERLTRLLKALVRSVAESLHDIGQSIARRDQESLRYSVHRLKGTLAMSGAVKVAEQCGRCLDHIDNSDNWDEVVTVWMTLDETLRDSLDSFDLANWS